MKYVVFKEVNYREKDSFYFFLQYDGNEDKLNSLADIMYDADYEGMCGDYSEFTIDVDNPVSQETVEEMIKVNMCCHKGSFEVCRGNFEFYEEDFHGLGPKELALKLDDMFFYFEITEFFK